MSHEPLPWCKILLLSLRDEALICVCVFVTIYDTTLLLNLKIIVKEYIQLK